MKRILIKTAKIAGIILLSLLLLTVILLFSLRFPAVQNFAKGHLVNYLEEKIGTPVTLDRVFVGFPNKIQMENLHLHGQKTDTLLYVGDLNVGLNIPKLLSNTVDLTDIDIENLRANVVRNPDGTFNFDYIIDAFVTKDEDATEESPWIISLDKINLENIGITFNDQQARNDLQVFFNRFNVTVQTFDLENNTYALGDLEMDGLKLKMHQDVAEEMAEEVAQTVDSLNQQSPLQIALDGIKLTNFDVDYADDVTQTYALVQFGEMSSDVNEIDLQKNIYDFEDFILKNAQVDAKLYLPEAEVDSVEETVIDNPNATLTVLLNEMLLENVQLKYSNTAAAPQPGMDFNDLNFTSLNLEAEDFAMKDGEISGTINAARIEEEGHLNVLNLSTEFLYGKEQTYLRNLHFETPRTLLQDEVVLTYASQEQLTQNPENVTISANIQNSRIGLADILDFMPSLRSTPPFDAYPNAIINLKTRLNGTLNDLNIAQLQASGLGDLQLTMNGRVQNAMDPDNIFYDLNISNLSGSAGTINRLVPAGTIPSNISLPSNIRLNGKARGTLEVIDADLDINSSDGGAHLIAQLDMRNEGSEKYNVDARLRNLNIGKIIQNQELGRIQGNIVAEGRSFDFANGYADLQGDIAYVDYNGYRYTNMVADGTLNNGNYVVELNSADSNADLDIVASGNLNDEYPTVDFTGTITKLDLQTLGFYTEPLILAGDIQGNFTSLNPDFLNGTLDLQNFAVSNREDVFPMQNISLLAESTSEGNLIRLNSQVADLEMTGKYKLTQIFSSLMATVDQYYDFQADETVAVDPGQYFELNATIKDDDLIRRFVPDLTYYESVQLTGSYYADSRNLQLQGEMPLINYGAYSLENATININTENDALVYAVNLGALSSEDLQLTDFDLNGDIADNLVNFNLSTNDTEGTERFSLAGNLESVDQIHHLSLNEYLVLNYENWQVNSGNSLQIGEGGFIADNFVLSHENSSIAIQSAGNDFNSPINVNFTDFNIETLTALIEKEELPAAGVLNGTVRLEDLQGNMSFNTNLELADLHFYGNPIGTVTANVENRSADVLWIDVALTEFDNDVQITGEYNTALQQFDLNADVNRLNMESLEGFSMENLANASGYLSGDLNITGSAEQPQIAGALKFNDVGFEVVPTGSVFAGMEDEIRFTSQGIVMNNFRMNDMEGNSLVIHGNIATTDYRDFGFDLTVNSEDFKLVDSEPNDDAMMYGILAIDTSLQIGGDLDLPIVDGSLGVTDITDFTFVVPQTTPTLQDREGIVQFIDRDQLALQETIVADSISSETQIRGMDVNVNISVDREAQISLIIDKATGDFVELKGEAELTGGIDPSGKTTLTGVYSVHEGAYELNVSLLERRFDIEEGSTITWTGEPLEATLDITANYKTEAAPIDLLQQQLSGLSPSEYNMYKQRIPFNTLLQLRGDIMEPEITFDITLDDDNPSIATAVIDNTRLKLNQIRNDESEMNKQVFALLLLNRFIGENPFQSESGMSAGTLARQSVSQILSQQLNNIASDLITGVDLDFDFNSYDDYSQGSRNTRTDLNIGLSKRLLNDKLKVTVGSSFGLEGSARQNEEMSNIAGDVMIDYMLSKDGRYILRAYRQNEYQVALQGQIIETGVGFIITLDYDEFRDIFRRSEQRIIDKQEKRNEN